MSRWLDRWNLRATRGVPSAVQDWFPITDVREGCLFRADGAVVGGIALAPMNLVLKSPRETRAIMTAVYAIVNSFQIPWQVLSHYRPLDLEAYLERLREQIRQVGPRRELWLRQYLEWVVAQQDAGQAMERRYYCLMTRTGPDAVALHQETLPLVVQEWNRIRGMQATVMDQAAWESLLFGFFHPTRLRQETVPDNVRRLTRNKEESVPTPVMWRKEGMADATIRMDQG